MAFKRREDMTDEERKAAQERMAKAREAAARTRAARMQHQGMPAAPEASDPAAAPSESAQSAQSNEPARLPLSEEALGSFAKNITGNPASEAAFERALNDCMNAWNATEPTETEKREAIYHSVRAIKAWRYHLGRIVVAGDQARRSSERLSTVA